MNRRRTMDRKPPAGPGILAGISRRSGRTKAASPKPAETGTPPVQNVSRPKAGAGYVLVVSLVFLLCAMGYIYHLHVRFEGVQLGYEASAQRKVQTRLLLERRELRLELASLKEQSRVEAEARKKLGMEVPSFDRIVPVDKKRRVVSVSGGAL